jgi:hypothetical protein
MENEKISEKSKNIRIEYETLRKEFLQADQACLLMTGYILAAVGVLHSQNLQWLCSILSLVGVFYYTEKRFLIRTIANFILNNISKEDSGFIWESYVEKLRNNKELRPWMILRPYNTEVILCSLIALSPISRGILRELFQHDLRSFTWLIFAVFTLVLAGVNAIKYQNLKKNKNPQST